MPRRIAGRDVDVGRPLEAFLQPGRGTRCGLLKDVEGIEDVTGQANEDANEGAEHTDHDTTTLNHRGCRHWRLRARRGAVSHWRHRSDGARSIEDRPRQPPAGMPSSAGGRPPSGNVSAADRDVSLAGCNATLDLGLEELRVRGHRSTDGVRRVGSDQELPDDADESQHRRVDRVGPRSGRRLDRSSSCSQPPRACRSRLWPASCSWST